MNSPALPCTLDKPELITVGTVFYLHCGDLPKESGYRLSSPQKDDYRLVLLSDSVGDKGLQVTSYRPGEHKLTGFKLLKPDGSAIALGEIDLAVQSVLTPGQQVQPIGPFAPSVLGVPLSLWITLTVLVVALSASIAALLITRKHRRKFLKELRSTEGYPQPLNHLHRNLRGLRRAAASSGDYKTFVSMLPQALRLYFEQSFEYSVSMSRYGWLQKFLRKMQADPQLSVYCVRRLRELNRLQGKDLLAKEDAEQIDKEIMHMIDRLEPYIAKARRGR